MFEKIVKAVEPFFYTVVIIGGLILTNRMQVADRVIVGYVLIGVGISLVVVHITRQIKTTETSKSKKG